MQEANTWPVYLSNSLSIQAHLKRSLFFYFSPLWGCFIFQYISNFKNWEFHRSLTKASSPWIIFLNGSVVAPWVAKNDHFWKQSTHELWHGSTLNKLNFKYSWSLHYFSKSSATVYLTLGTPEFPQNQKGRRLNSVVFLKYIGLLHLRCMHSAKINHSIF